MALDWSAEQKTIQRSIRCVGIRCSHLGIVHSRQIALCRCKFIVFIILLLLMDVRSSCFIKFNSIYFSFADWCLRDGELFTRWISISAATQLPRWTVSITFLSENIFNWLKRNLLSFHRFTIMAYCWAVSILERPTFKQLMFCLQDFYNQLTRFVWGLHKVWVHSDFNTLNCENEWNWTFAKKKTFNWITLTPQILKLSELVELTHASAHKYETFLLDHTFFPLEQFI